MMKDKYKVLIRSCWALLLVCFGIKIFGGNLFEIVCENERFISLCDYIDNSMFFKILVNCISAFILDSLSFLAIMQYKMYNKKLALIVIPMIIISSISFWYFPILKSILEIGFMIIIPLIYKVNWKRIVIGILLIFAFQIVSLITRNIGQLYLDCDKTLIVLIINIDTFIMSILYYLYATRKER